MASVTDLVKGNVGTGVLIGIGAVVLAPIVAPVVAAAAKPLIKTLIKTGIVAYEKSKEAFAEAGEALEDLVAEAAAELEQESPRSNGGESEPARARIKAPSASRA
jgi:hypothetical protein